MTMLAMYQADAFTDRRFTGNPAAVLLTRSPLDDALMQAIAAENNLAETAFVTPEGDDWAIRWFTPEEEVAFCGHATLASAHVMAAELGLGDSFRFATRKVGTLAVRRAAPGRYTLDSPRLAPEATTLPPDLAGLFPAGHVAAFRTFENIFVELPTPDAVLAWRPDLPAIAAATRMGLGITAKGGTGPQGQAVDFVSRYFAPAVGITEDPVTGSAHATLAPYWAARLGRRDLLAYQASRRGGLVACRVGDTRVHLTGSVVTVFRADLRLGD